MIGRFLRKSWKDKLKVLFDLYSLKSYSQEGEDMILRRLFEVKATGFYVDVGAHHPQRFSNTYFFYKRDWTGINIDAMPGSMARFNEIRPRDINLEFAIGNTKDPHTYYHFNDPALNGFDAQLSKVRDEQDGSYKIVKIESIETKRLEHVLDEYLPAGQSIDFLSVDVEGWDFDVLQSNDWSRYKPSVVLVEVLGSSLDEIANSEITEYMREQGYSLFAKTMNTVFFKLQLE